MYIRVWFLVALFFASVALVGCGNQPDIQDAPDNVVVTENKTNFPTVVNQKVPVAKDYELDNAEVEYINIGQQTYYESMGHSGCLFYFTRQPVKSNLYETNIKNNTDKTVALKCTVTWVGAANKQIVSQDIIYIKPNTELVHSTEVLPTPAIDRYGKFEFCYSIYQVL